MLAFLDFFGIAVFAMSGALVAGQKGFDVFGVMVVALVACLGGGTLRDLILDAHPVVWIENTAYLAIALIAAFSTFFWVRLKRQPLRTLEICDAIGLTVFTLAGAEKALQLGNPLEICLLMGLMTGVAGGVLRDVLCNELPLIFHKEIYATAAIAGGGIYLLMIEAGCSVQLATLVGAAIILGLRLAGIFRGWSLPAFLKARNES